MSILIIEDHADIVEIVEHNLEREGFRLSVAMDGESGLNKALQEPPVLVLLDLMLPNMSGLEVCRRLRESKNTSHVPIIMLTAKGEEKDIICGLELGADDYVTKPFSPKELVARIKSVLRRAGIKVGTSSSQVIKVDGLEIDLARHSVHLNGESIKLTLTEFRLLHGLIEGEGRIFTRDQLIDRVRGEDITIVDRNIDVHISSLRRKLKDYGARILTIRGVGYRFQE